LTWRRHFNCKHINYAVMPPGFLKQFFRQPYVNFQITWYEVLKM
jgi:hypothetical protein